MDREELAYAGVARQARMVRDGEVSPRELVELYLERIDRLNGKINAYRVVMAEEALEDARRAEERRAAGEQAPLLGVPIAIKDNVDVTGQVTTFGTDCYETPATEDSEIVRRLRSAGAIVLGKTNLPELAICGFTESKTWGVTRNPWNLDHTPGGSSGGSAAAVAAGLAPAAHASDGAGSIRIPSALCGLFGLKPQRNRVTFAPFGEHWKGMSVNGFVTRSVVDQALLLDTVIAEGSTKSPAPPPLSRTLSEAAAEPPGKLRIAISTKPPRVAAPPKVTNAVEAAVSAMGDVLRSLGHEVYERDPAYGMIGNAITPRYLGGIREDVKGVPNPDRLESRTRGFGRLGATVTGGQIRRAIARGDRDAERIAESLGNPDVFVTPTTGSLPLDAGRWEGKGALRTLMGMSAWYPFAPVWNHTGQPAASIPAGWDEASGLPKAVMLVGRPNDEPTLISLAAQIEAARPWAQRTPNL
ncbi:MAG: amidase [Solirubrobacterales bacterium]|nr:amidase [Solirubrobacterales bacterium]